MRWDLGIIFLELSWSGLVGPFSNTGLRSIYLTLFSISSFLVPSPWSSVRWILALINLLYLLIFLSCYSCLYFCFPHWRTFLNFCFNNYIFIAYSLWIQSSQISLGLLNWVLWVLHTSLAGFPGGSVAGNPPADAGDIGLIPGLERAPGEGNGNSLQYSCLGNPVDRGAGGLQSVGLKKSWTLSNSTTSSTFPWVYVFELFLFFPLLFEGLLTLDCLHTFMGGGPDSLHRESVCRFPGYCPSPEGEGWVLHQFYTQASF